MLKNFFTALLLSAISVYSLAVLEPFIIRSHIAGVTINNLTHISGIIIPHHDLAREYIISSLSQISQQHQYPTIVVIGPNHFQPSSASFLSTLSYNDYPIDSKIIKQLSLSEFIDLDTATCQGDHSLGIPLRYLRQYFPNALFVPILSPMNYNSDNIAKLSKTLTSLLPPDTLFVASVDFSHGKTLLEAVDKNRQSESAIRNFDYQQIYRFHDDHLDSPFSIGLLLNTMQNIGATNWQTWTSTHGSLIDNQLDLPATSYLIGVFDK